MNAENVHIELRGDGINVNRYRVRGGEPHETSLYVDVRGEHTLAELVAYLIEHAEMRPDMGNVRFSGGCFRVTIPATSEDIARWDEGDARRAQAARESRRRHYERLRTEFEPDRTYSPGRTP